MSTANTFPPGPVAGIVAEYNPFHAGHAWMIRQLRSQGFAAVVCVMSGAFAQRAEPAFFPPAVRARAALAGGADLVIRLPLAWAVASAEAFGAAGVGLLGALGCVDTLAFGAETPDTEALARVADALQSPDFSLLLGRRLAGGTPFAVARAAAAEQLVPGAKALLSSPNNILAVEYLKALKGPAAAELQALHRRKNMENEGADALPGRREGPDAPPSARGFTPPQGAAASPARPPFHLPRPLALARQGSAHDGTPVGQYASASWLRHTARLQGVGAWGAWVPADCLPLYLEAEAAGEAIDPARWELAALARLRGLSAAELAALPGAGGGLNHRLARAIGQATSLEELYAAAKTKHYTHSRVRRLALWAVLGLRAPAGPFPPFLQVLAASQKGIALLRRARKTALLPLSGSAARLAKTGPEAETILVNEAAAEDLYALCQHRPRASGRLFSGKPFLLPKETGT